MIVAFARPFTQPGTGAALPILSESWTELPVGKPRVLQEVATRQAERFSAESDRTDAELQDESQCSRCSSRGEDECAPVRPRDREGVELVREVPAGPAQGAVARAALLAGRQAPRVHFRPLG